MRRGAAVALAILALSGCGGGGNQESGDLAWVETPRLYTAEAPADARVLQGKVKNDSLRRLELTPADLRLVGRDGKPVKASVVFIDYFLHGLHPPTREPDLPDSELRRTGRQVRLEPGQTAPLTVSWSAATTSEPPVRVDYGTGSLPVPKVAP